MVHAATLGVCPEGPPRCGYRSIQTAIDDASAGDEVLVADGTYLENIDFQGKDISVRSVGGPGATVIDGGGADSVVTFTTGETRGAVLEGFTLQRGGGRAYNGPPGATFGGGIFMLNSSPTISNCRIVDNEAGWAGAAVYMSASSPLITGCTVARNRHADGGSRIETIKIDDGFPRIENCSIYDNAGYRGAIHVWRTTYPWSNGLATEIVNCDIYNNNCRWTDEGGYTSVGYAISAHNSVVINGTTVRNNNGNGIYISESPALIQHCSVTGNQGMGILMLGQQWQEWYGETVEDGRISHCIISGNGGTGLLLGGSFNEKYPAYSPVVANSVISGNENPSGTSVDRRSGGGVTIRDNTEAVFSNVLITGNISSFYGGGVHVDGKGYSYTKPTFINSTVSGNRAESGGGGIFAVDTAEVRLVNSILWGNLAGEGKGGEIYSPVSPPEYPQPAEVAATFSIIRGGDPENPGFPWPGTGNLRGDPLFVRPRSPAVAPTTAGDYHLKSNSTAIDAGVSDTALYPGLPATDIDGEPRPYGKDYDLGSDEWDGLELDVKVNGSDGGLLLQRSDTAEITVSLQAGNREGLPSELWIVAQTPIPRFPWVTYKIDSGKWVPGLRPSRQSACQVMPEEIIFRKKGLPSGQYRIYFGLDRRINGKVDWDSLVKDMVRFAVRD